LNKMLHMASNALQIMCSKFKYDLHGLWKLFTNFQLSHFHLNECMSIYKVTNLMHMLQECLWQHSCNNHHIQQHHFHTHYHCQMVAIGNAFLEYFRQWKKPNMRKWQNVHLVKG
jgi:hypothetical protein